MVIEKWKIGNKFEVVKDRKTGYLKKEDKGICYGIASKEEKTIYFDPEKTTSIHIYRLKKLNIIPIYELW